MKIFNGEFDRYLDIDFLRASGAQPHFFLDFIQLKIDDRFRMHFWHEDLPAFGAEEELHDHRYNFTSRVMVGETTHEEWYFTPANDGDMEIIEKSCKPGSEIPPRQVAVGKVARGGTYTMARGSVYHFPHDRFHRIRTRRCVTLLERDIVIKDVARIIKPVGAADICPFERKIGTDVLWGYIEELLREGNGQLAKPGYHLREIPRGVVGEASKIVEEALEFADAIEQSVDLMAMIELSDLQGAISAYLAKHHPTFTLESLAKMSEVTQRAFRNGHR